MVAQEMMQCNNFCESRSEFVALVEDSAAVKDGRISAHDDSPDRTLCAALHRPDYKDVAVHKKVLTA
jgi:hypothetical protein